MTKEARFAALVSDVAREVVRRRSSDACCGDLTLEQFETMQAVVKSDQAMTIGALSTALGVDISTMSRNVSVLERNGYLARLRNLDDGRVVHVRLTPRGKKALTTLRCGERDVLTDVYTTIPAAERQKVLEALEVLRASMIGSKTAGACCAPAAPISIRRRSA